MLHDLVSGTDARSRLDAAPTPRDVDSVLSTLLDVGAAPGYLAVDDWRRVRVSNPSHELELLVAPDYASVGTADDVYRLSRTTPYGAQDYADRLYAILPSRKIVSIVESASSPKIPFIDVKSHGVALSAIESPEAADLASELAQAAYDSRDLPAGGGLTYGYKKSIVVAPNLDGSRVAIYGGRYSSGALVQPFGTPHSSSYSDYSHGVMLVSRRAVLDGVSVDLRSDVFGSTDPSVYGLVSDQGRFDPVFPNAGSGSRAEFGASGSGGGGGGGGGPSTSTPGKAKGKPSPSPGVVTSSRPSAFRVLAGLGVLAAGAWYLFWRS